MSDQSSVNQSDTSLFWHLLKHNTTDRVGSAVERWGNGKLDAINVSSIPAKRVYINGVTHELIASDYYKQLTGLGFILEENKGKYSLVWDKIQAQTLACIARRCETKVVQACLFASSLFIPIHVCIDGWKQPLCTNPFHSSYCNHEFSIAIKHQLDLKDRMNHPLGNQYDELDQKLFDAGFLMAGYNNKARWFLDVLPGLPSTTDGYSFTSLDFDEIDHKTWVDHQLPIGNVHWQWRMNRETASASVAHPFDPFHWIVERTENLRTHKEKRSHRECTITFEARSKTKEILAALTKQLILENALHGEEI